MRPGRRPGELWRWSAAEQAIPIPPGAGSGREPLLRSEESEPGTPLRSGDSGLEPRAHSGDSGLGAPTRSGDSGLVALTLAAARRVIVGPGYLGVCSARRLER